MFIDVYFFFSKIEKIMIVLFGSFMIFLIFFLVLSRKDGEVLV